MIHILSQGVIEESLNHALIEDDEKFQAGIQLIVRVLPWKKSEIPSDRELCLL